MIGSFLPPNLSTYRILPWFGRLAVAVDCFENYCHAKELAGPTINAFVSHLRDLSKSPSFPEWENQNEELTQVGLGGAFSSEMCSLLETAAISETDFRELVSAIVEIVYGSAYGAFDDEGSLKWLARVLEIAWSAGVVLQPAERFLKNLSG